MDRRSFIASALLALSGLSGCLGDSSTNQSSSDSPTSTTAPTATSTKSPTDSPTESPTVSATAIPAPESFLPDSQSDWQLERTSDYEWGPLGGSDGIIGLYRGPDGDMYQLLVMQDANNASGSARSFACAGWQLAFAYNAFAIAASTGTDQRTFTPEKPPTMSETPAENKLEMVRKLVLLSPRLSEADVPEQTSCPYR